MGDIIIVEQVNFDQAWILEGGAAGAVAVLVSPPDGMRVALCIRARWRFRRRQSAGGFLCRGRR